MFAVEQYDIVGLPLRCLAKTFDDVVLAAGDARELGHGHGDSMLASDPDMKAALIKRFETEIAGLERELTQDLPKEIQRARELGDLRENAEYQAAKERQRFVEARVSMLKKRVSEIQLMNLDRIPHDRAGFGSKLVIRENGKTFTYELVMPEDSDPDKGLISVASPIGRALVGKEAGDEVTAPTPAGVRNFEVVKLTTIHDEEA
jgi:transcription elongation factor GreA